MATALLGVFVVTLLTCSLLGVPTVWPLLGGALLFFGYGAAQGHSWLAMARAALSSVHTVGKILVTFLLIGVLTAMWRASGTIVYIVDITSGMCSGPVILLATFLLCCLMSFLTGTSFGTAVTMGTICAFIATNAGAPILLTGGAVLSGSYFGDRCSPVSTSSLLVATLTGTSVPNNIPAMVRSSLMPFVLACVLFLGMGVLMDVGADASSVAGLSGQKAVGSTQIATGFNLTPWELMPAILVLGLSLLRLDVWIVLAAGAVSAAVLACVCQGMDVPGVALACVAGFSPLPGQSSLMAGGGIVSMLAVAAIVLVSSTYAGIFEQTHMLDGVHDFVAKIAARFGSFAAVLLASTACAVVCCNQSLTIMLGHQLSRGCESDAGKFALQLEDTAVVVSALVPWSIACAVPLAAVGAPPASVFFAFYLWLVPAWNLGVELVRFRREQSAAGADAR